MAQKQKVIFVNLRVSFGGYIFTGVIISGIVIDKNKTHNLYRNNFIIRPILTWDDMNAISHTKYL